MKKSILAASAMFTLASYTVVAEEKKDTVESVMVWGTTLESSSVYLGEQDIAIKQADHMSDLLRAIPGVDIGGTHSVNTRINVRGLDDRDLAVYIDNALQTNYLYHHMGNILINPDILKSASIELGSRSVAYGGLGGAVRFETKDAKDLLRNGETFGGRAYASYQSNSQEIISLTGYGVVGDSIDYLVYYNATDRDNFEDGSGQETIGSDGETENLLLKGGLNISDQHRLELSAELYYDRGDYGQRPDMGYQAADGLSGSLAIPLFDTEYDRETINFGYEGTFSATDINANLYFNSMRLYRDERAGIVHPFGFIIPSTEKEVTADNVGLSVVATTGFSNHQVNYGLEYFDQSFEFDADLNSAAMRKQKQDATSVAVFVEDRISITDALAVTPGVRYTDHNMEVETTNLDESWDDTVVALAIDYRVNKGLELLASYTELFKAPELAEPFQGNGGTLLPNADLNPESGENIEVGLRYAHQLTNDANVNMGFNIFETTIDDYITIQRLPAPSGDQQYVNSGTAVIDGYEASINYETERFDVLLSYARSDLDGSELLVNDTTESLREIGDSMTLEVNFNVSQELKANYNILKVKDKDREFGGEEKPGYIVHNLSVRYQPAALEAVSFIAGVDNVFDEEYTSHASREGVAPFTTPPTILNDVEPGRNYKFSVAYEF